MVFAFNIEIDVFRILKQKKTSKKVPNSEH